ncbi:MAG: hypothetical protein AAGF95_15585 [Chloroflexota bacterium]
MNVGMFGHSGLRLLMGAVMIIVLTACGANAPTPGNTEESGAASADGSDEAVPAAPDVALFPGAESPESDDPMAMVMDTFQEQVATQNAGATVEAYVLPQGTTFDDVQSHYESELTGRGWTTFAGGEVSTGIGQAIWTNEDSTQTYTIQVFEDPTQPDMRFLFVVQTDA